MTTKLGETDGLLTDDSAGEVVIDLREYWNVIRRHKKSIVAMPLIAMILATLVVFSMKPVYQSTATLLIETEVKKIVSIEEVYSGGQQSRKYLNTQFEVIKSHTLARKVIDELDLIRHPYFLSDEESQGQNDSIGHSLQTIFPDAITSWLEPQHTDNSVMQETSGLSVSSGKLSGNKEMPADEFQLRKLVKQFSWMMTVSPVRNTQLVHISFDATDNQLAAQMANQMAQMYIQDQMDARLEMTAQANSWLSDRLTSIRKKLKKSENELQIYREREKLIEVGGVTGLASKQLQELTQELIISQQKLNSLEAARNQIRQIRSGNYQDYLSIPAVLNDNLVSQLIKGASDKQQDLETLNKRYGPKHPKIIFAKAAYNSSNEALNKHVLSVVEGIEHQYQLARSSESSTLKILSNSKQDMQNINRKQHQLGLLQREVEANRQMYELFLNRIKETTASRGIDKANARIVDRAIAAIDPIKPKKKLIVLIAGFLGLGFGVFMVFLFEHLDNTLKSAIDVEERLKLVVLGVLPLIHKKVSELWQFAMVEPKSIYTEGIRTIRTGIILSSLDNPHKIIMVTSSMPNEGKSNIAANTAINLSEMNKVLLIDGDLRKPTISNLFGLEPNANGLSELLAGTVDKKSCTHRWSDSQLYILPSGAIPPNPLELISSNAFKQLLESLSQNFDHIIIDTPPVLPVSDACLISTMVNGVIYVIKADSTPLPIVNDGLKRLRQSRAHILGGVLNQFDTKKHQQYGEYGNYAYTAGYYTESYGTE